MTNNELPEYIVSKSYMRLMNEFYRSTFEWHKSDGRIPT